MARNRSSSSQEGVIAFLVLIVIVETFLLLRPYFKKPEERIRPRKKSVAVQPLRPSMPEPVVPPPVRPAPPPPATEAPVIPAGKGMIAVIIDDSGYSASDCERLAAITHPVTISILPNLEFSKSTAYCAHRNDKEIMLHLPLEPYKNNEKYPEDYIIKTSMPDKMVLRRLEESLASIPFADGVNNHMGSKATENSRTMKLILTDLKSRGMFFVDSHVTAKSIVPKVATDVRIPFAVRDVFLDNDNDRRHIEAQFAVLAQKARKNGSAIAIGHARILTWQIVREQLDKLSQLGYEIVTVNDILHLQSR